jgi:hypothetical protein
MDVATQIEKHLAFVAAGVRCRDPMAPGHDLAMTHATSSTMRALAKGPKGPKAMRCIIYNGH